MPKLPIVNAKQVIKALEKIDFQIVRQRGSDIQMKHKDGRFVTIASHSSQTIGKGLLLKILRDAELTKDVLTNYLIPNSEKSLINNALLGL